MDPDAFVDNYCKARTDFVPVLRSVETYLLRKIFFLLCGPDLLRSRMASRLWRDTIADLTRPCTPGHAFLRRSIAWSMCDKPTATRTDMRPMGGQITYVFGAKELVVLNWAFHGEDICSLYLQIRDRWNLRSILFRQKFEKIAGIGELTMWQLPNPGGYATIHNNTLVVGWQCYYKCKQKPIEMRFVSVCLSTFTVVKDILHPIKDDITHVWIERQVMETGKENIRQEILQGLREEDRSIFHYQVDSAGYVLILKAQHENTYDVTVYDANLQVRILRHLKLLWPITAVQYAHPIVVLTLKSSFWALWNVEMPGRPAALWCGLMLRSPKFRTAHSCVLKSNTHVNLHCEWYFNDSYAESHLTALLPPEKAINVIAGDTGHPPEPTRLFLTLSDFKGSQSLWRIQTQQGDGSIQFPHVCSPRVAVKELKEEGGEHLFEDLKEMTDYYYSSDSDRNVSLPRGLEMAA